ncbi:hypothetical protein J2T20_004142 [Paenibacillus wynnii]|nr:hypothetical protein [Paenibacillus wynnii]
MGVGGSSISTEHQQRTINHGPRTTDHGPRTINHGPRTTNHQPPTIDHRPIIEHQPSILTMGWKLSNVLVGEGVVNWEWMICAYQNWFSALQLE